MSKTRKFRIICSAHPARSWRWNMFGESDRKYYPLSEVAVLLLPFIWDIPLHFCSIFSVSAYIVNFQPLHGLLHIFHFYCGLFLFCVIWLSSMTLSALSDPTSIRSLVEGYMVVSCQSSWRNHCCENGCIFRPMYASSNCNVYDSCPGEHFNVGASFHPLSSFFWPFFAYSYYLVLISVLTFLI